jgi:hypothetical protein
VAELCEHRLTRRAVATILEEEEQAAELLASLF